MSNAKAVAKKARSKARKARAQTVANGTPVMFPIDEFCADTGLGRTFVYEEIAAGRLKAVKAGRRTFITRQHRDEYVASLPERPLSGQTLQRQSDREMSAEVA